METTSTNNGVYTQSQLPDTNAWTSIGTKLAKCTSAYRPFNAYTIVSITKKPVRAYYRLKIFISEVVGGDDISTIDPKYRKEEQEHYNYVLSENINKSLPFTENGWKRERLVQLYKKSLSDHNEDVTKYKKGEKVYFDAGFDLFCPAYAAFERFDDGSKKLDHCVKCSMEKVDTDKDGNETTNPVGYYLFPRSSTGTKTPLSLSNSVGIIDSGYRGNIISAFYCSRTTDKYVTTMFQRLVQICPPDISYPVEVVLVDCEEDLGGGGNRGSGGFGSTGS